MFDALTLVQEAALRIGEEPPQSLDEFLGTDSLARVFSGVADFCLDLHPWTFCTEVRPLSRLDLDSPVRGYPHVFELPADAVGQPLAIFADLSTPDAPYAGFTYHGARVLALDAPVHALLTVRPPPARWPGAFREAVRLALAAELALALASDDGLRDKLRADAFGTPSEMYRGGAMGVAIRNQGWRAPPQRLASGDPFSASWQGAWS